MGMVALSPHHVPLDLKSGAQTVKTRERERARNETSAVDAMDKSKIDATSNSTTSATKYHKLAAITSTTPPVKRGYISPGTPGPLPSIYGTVVSGGRN